MRTSGLLTRTLFVLGILSAATAVNAEKLDLVSAGTTTVGGFATFNIASPNAPTLFNNISNSELSWNIYLTGGQFVLNGLEIAGLITSGGTFDSASIKSVGIGVGARYFFDIDSVIYPYVGILPTFNYFTSNSQNTLNPNSNGALWTLRLPVAAGILIGLNCFLALDIGIRAAVHVALNPQAKKCATDPEAFGYGTSNPGFDLAAGYVGVKGFF